MEQNQFEILMLAITGLKTEMVKGFANADKRMDRIETKLDATFNQVSHMASEAANLEKRVSKLEGPAV